ncbi:MAG: hypothetical protein A2Y86_05180 [Candidatus Aminicenantes bacterium RBG_13_62_12]|nr:MAG: hypothetical protein A2Y86_05180 [Candidatus Aminicenantes bacterium RBG_13_62_12]
MAYVITLKIPGMQIYVREPLVGGEFSREEWERRGGAALEPKGDFEDTNDRAFRETLLERPFLVCRKFTTGLRIVVFLDNIGMIEELPDERVRQVLEEIQAQMKAAMERAEKDAGGRKVTTPPFMGPGFKIPQGRQ